MSFSIRTATIFLALACAGLWVSAASAEPARKVPLQVTEDAGSCRVDDSGAPPAPRAPAFTAEQLQAIKARMLAAVEADQASGVIPLNGRGYNYRAANDPTWELLQIQRELEAQAAR